MTFWPSMASFVHEHFHPRLRYFYSKSFLHGLNSSKFMIRDFQFDFSRCYPLDIPTNLYGLFNSRTWSVPMDQPIQVKMVRSPKCFAVVSYFVTTFLGKSCSIFPYLCFVIHYTF